MSFMLGLLCGVVFTCAVAAWVLSRPDDTAPDEMFMGDDE